ncbi:MAG: CDP-alcohol phosphatidyltransferase family protein [Ktedonobacteraceae bacterium]
MTQAPGENVFVIDLLTTLREDKYSPRGWWRFLVRSWNMACQTARQHPSLQRSWARNTLLNGTLAVVVLALSFALEGSATAWRLLPGFLFCVVWQQSDLFWHLGLNRRSTSGELLSSIGLANMLTGWRGLCGSFLLGRLLGGISTPIGLALGVFLLGVVTDILDGQVARRTQTQSKLGQIADGEADFCLYLAITLILAQHALLPLWLVLVMLCRFVLPLLAALVCYFALARPVRFGSTIVGKWAGLAQCLYFLLLLVPPSLTFLTGPLQLPLLIVTVGLLVLAPLAQIVTNVWVPRAAS